MNATHEYIRDIVLPAANYLLPDKMHSERADLLSTAIGFKESRFTYRKQIGGPARGFWQFEIVGVQAVLRHDATREHIQRVLKLLNYDFSPSASYEAIAHNDTLAAVYARLLIWSDPRPLPSEDDVAGMHAYYQRNWRPGKPREELWPIAYASALDLLNGRTINT